MQLKAHLYAHTSANKILPQAASQLRNCMTTVDYKSPSSRWSPLICLRRFITALISAESKKTANMIIIQVNLTASIGAPAFISMKTRSVVIAAMTMIEPISCTLKPAIIEPVEPRGHIRSTNRSFGILICESFLVQVVIKVESGHEVRVAHKKHHKYEI